MQVRCLDPSVLMGSGIPRGKSGVRKVFWALFRLRRCIIYMEISTTGDHGSTAPASSEHQPFSKHVRVFLFGFHRMSLLQPLMQTQQQFRCLLWMPSEIGKHRRLMRSRETECLPPEHGPDLECARDRRYNIRCSSSNPGDFSGCRIHSAQPRCLMVSHWVGLRLSKGERTIVC